MEWILSPFGIGLNRGEGWEIEKGVRKGRDCLKTGPQTRPPLGGPTAARAGPSEDFILYLFKLLAWWPGLLME